MKLPLQIFSWIGIVLGVFAIIGAFAGNYDQFGNATIDPYALLGGGLFFLQGLLALLYISEKEKETF
jgi:hypothetical protein